MEPGWHGISGWVRAAFLVWMAGGPALAQETHPILIIGREDIPALRSRLGNATVAGTVGAALASTLRGRRDEAAIAALRDGAAGAAGDRKYDALLIYDLQYDHLTAEERTAWKEAFFADAKAQHDIAVGPNPNWWFVERFVSNWTYRHAGFPLQRILLPALMFPEDPRSPALRDLGLKLLRWVMEAGPNDGEWDPAAKSWRTAPKAGEMIDETLGTPNSYGVWGAHNLNELMHMVDRNTDFKPYARLDGMMRSEARYWTYLLAHREGRNFNGFGVSSLASYGGQAGHGRFDFLGVYSNSFMLHWARVYQDPVFAWHFLAHPSPLFNNRATPYLDDWNAPQASYPVGWLSFLDWGQVAPRSPREAGWPLHAFWPNAGAAVIRKSWEKKGPGTGLVWMRAGAGGGHDRPAQLAVQYHADDTVLLGSAPWFNYDNPLLVTDPRANNTLLVDGRGQAGNYAGSGELERMRHGSARQLGPDTYVLSSGPADPSRRDYQDYYRQLPFKLSWRRKVHYDRWRDILWIKDAASAGDGASHSFRFNWVSRAAVAAPDRYLLPGGYVMVAASTLPLQATLERYLDSVPREAFTAISAGGDGPSIRVRWAVAKDEAAARAMLAAQGGAFIHSARGELRGSDAHLRWETDEPARGRLEWGPSPALGQAARLDSLRLSQELLLPGAGDVHFRIIAVDAYGDETIHDDGGKPWRISALPTKARTGSGPAMAKRDGPLYDGLGRKADRTSRPADIFWRHRFR